MAAYGTWSLRSPHGLLALTTSLHTRVMESSVNPAEVPAVSCQDPAGNTTFPASSQTPPPPRTFLPTVAETWLISRHSPTSFLHFNPRWSFAVFKVFDINEPICSSRQPCKIDKVLLSLTISLAFCRELKLPASKRRGQEHATVRSS